MRRGSRGRPRIHNRDGSGSSGNGRVSNYYGAQHQEKEEDRAPPPPPPCTDFDMAYFHSYAHVGIHEEMIKVVYCFLKILWLIF